MSDNRTTGRYEVTTRSGGRYRVDLAEGDNIQSVIAQIEAQEQATAKRAELFDGTILEFENGTPDDVIESVARRETERIRSEPARRSLPDSAGADRRKPLKALDHDPFADLPNETAGDPFASLPDDPFASLPDEPRSGGRRGGTRSETKPYVAGTAPSDPARMELPAGVKPSTAGAGRGSVNPLNATVSRADSDYKDKLDAINDAVDRIELGMNPEKVFASFSKLGVGRDEIIARGVQLGSPAFVKDERQVTVRPGALDGQIDKRETGFVEDAANFGKRVGARASQAATGVLAQTGLMGSDFAAEMLAKDQRRIEAAAPSEDVQQQIEQLGKVKEWGEVPGAIVQNPKGVLMMLAESVALTAPLLAASAARIGAAGMAGVAGASSGGIEYGSALADALSDRGVSLTDVEQVSKLLKDESFMADTRARAAKRGVAVGAFDALTAGLAGRFIEPALEAVRAGKLTGMAANKAVAGAWGKELGMQAGGGMAGEQLGQMLTGEHKPLDVALEGLGEMASAPVEALSNTRDARHAKALAAMPEPAQPTPVRAEAMPTTVIPPEVLAAETARADAIKTAAAQARLAPDFETPGNKAGGPQEAANAPAGYPNIPEAAQAAQAGRQPPRQAPIPTSESRARPVAAEVPGPQPGQIERGAILARARNAGGLAAEPVEPEPSPAPAPRNQVVTSAEAATDARLERLLAEASGKGFATRSHAIVWLANNRVMSKLRPAQDGEVWRVEPLAWAPPAAAAISPEPTPVEVDNSSPSRKLRRKRRAAERAVREAEQAQPAEPKATEPQPAPAKESTDSVPARSGESAPGASLQGVPPVEGAASPEGVIPPVEAAATQTEPVAEHVDPGAPAEPATAAVIDSSVQHAAARVERKPSAMRADLLAQIDAAIAEAPSTAAIDATIHLPEARKSGGKMEFSGYRQFGPDRYAGAVDIAAREGSNGTYLVNIEDVDGGTGQTTLREIGVARGTPAEVREQITGMMRRLRGDGSLAEPEHLTFDVPGDGEFRVVRTKERLAEFRKQVEASPGFKNRQPVPAPAGATGLHLGSESAKAAIKAMIDEGDAQAAVDYARAKGIDIAAALADDKVRLPKIASIVPTDLRGGPVKAPASEVAQAAPETAPVKADAHPAEQPAAKTAEPVAQAPTAEKPAGKPISDAEAFADDYARFEGRTVEEPVLIEDTGKIATLRMDAARALRQLDAKAQALERGETDDELRHAIDSLVASGLNLADAERVARGDARVNLQNERDELVTLLREQHPDLFVAVRIDDAGEKIGGARKDRWRERGLNLDDLDAMTEAEGASVVGKAAVWKPDYEAMVESGTAPELAALVKGIYDSLAAKPRDNTPAGRRRYVTALRAVREVYGSLSGEPASAMRKAAEALRDKLGINSADRAVMTEARQTLFSIYKGRSDPFVVGYDDLRRAKKLVADGFPGKVQPWVRKYDILPVGGAGSTEHGIARVVEQSAGLGTPLTVEQVKAGAFSVIGRKSRKTVAMAPSRPDAEAAARAVYERELKSGDDKQTPDRPHLDTLERTGLPEGVERDVTADDFLTEFGFRGVEFGNWTAQDERQKMLNMAFDGLHDLAQIIGVPPKALSLNGTLGMAFGARGGGRFAAHYEPGKLVINLTKLQGGGSLAHEWAHALDHYFGELDRADAYSTTARGASGWYAKGQYTRPMDNLRPETGEAFNAVMRSLFKKTLPQAEAVRRAELELERVQQRQAEAKGDAMALVYRESVQRAEKALEEARAGKPAGVVATDYSKEAIKLSGKSTNGYWQRPTEMFARAFESYVFDRLLGMGAKSEYLVHGVESERFAGGTYKGNPYPVGEERAAIDDAFKRLFETIKTRETDKGVAMFARRPGTTAMTADEVRDVVETMTTPWANAPQIEVIATMNDAPEPVKHANDKQIAGGAKGAPAAFFYDGKVYVMASEMDGAATVAEAVLHEALGHYGLRGTFGNALNDVLKQVAKDRPELVRAKLEGYGLDFDNEADRLMAAEEVLAELAQTEPRSSLVQRAIAAIRAWLREFMPALELSDAEIVANIIEPARQFVEIGAGRADGGTAFARAEDPKSEAFRKWFGKSKVVDAAGQPLRLFHGTARDFSEFRVSKRGTLGPGVYFTADPNEASIYAEMVEGPRSPPHVMPVYLSLQNPLRVRNPKLPEHRTDVFHDVMPGTGVATKAFTAGQDPYGKGKLQTQLIAAWHSGNYYFGEPIRKKLIEQGHDGVIAEFDDPADGSTEYVAFRPEQVKSAIGNSGAYDPQNPDIRFQRQLGRHSLRAFGRGAQIVETIQDRYNRWKHAVEDIKAQGGLVTDENDFYKAEERYWGRVGVKLDEFNDELHDFVRDVAKDGATLEQVVLYAYAEHAPERNAYITAKRPEMRGNGSGMTDEEAAQLIAEAKQAGIEPVLQKHTATVRGWIQGTRDVLYDGGLIGAAQYDAWTGMFKAYVPLRGIDAEPESTGPRPGFNIKGQEGKEAEGRTSRAKHVLEEVVRDRTRALLRVGKNDVLRSLAQFVLDNPSPDLWSVEVVEDKSDPGLDEDGERVIADDAPVTKDFVTLKDAGQEIRVHIRDAKLLDQLRAVNREDNPSRPIAALLFANRVLGRLYTSMSPVFTVVNFTRDVQTAAVGLIDEIGFMAAPKLFAKLPRALFEAWQAETGKKSADYQLFAAMGGKTSFFNLRDIDEQAAELEWLVKHGQRSHLNPLKFGASALRLIETINGGIENATRLAAFKVAREAGRSEPQAASIAKNITVNFNRRGTQQLASAWILFFNPAVQGTARIAQSLKHPRVIGTLAVAMMGVAALALRNASMGEDDDGVSWWDKIPDSVKERNFVIVLPPGASGGEGIAGSKTGRYVKIPMPYGYNFFAVVANQFVDLWRHSQDPTKGRDLKEAVVNAFSGFMNAWLPVGSLGQAAMASNDEAGAKSLVLAATPDALDPIMQSMLNLNAFGRKMAPDDPRAQKRPDSENYFSGQAGQPFQRAASALNRATGGSKYESGLIDLSPATLENLARGYLGAPMSFGLDIVNAMYARHGIERPELDVKRLPFAKQFYAVIDNETDRMAGYARLDKAEAIAEPIRRAKKAGDEIEADRLFEQSGSLAELGRAAQRTRRRLSALSKREREIVEGDQGAGDKYALLLENAAQKRQVLQDFTRAYDDAVLDAVKAKKKEVKK